MDANPFDHSTYLLRGHFFKPSFRIYDPTGTLALFASLNKSKLNEGIAFYPDESKSNELFRIKARNIADFIFDIFDVFDPATNEKIGAFKQRGFKSILENEWIIIDAADNEIGIIQEDSRMRPTLRGSLFRLFILGPQSFHGDVGGTSVLRFNKHLIPFVTKIDLDFTNDFGNLLDRRLGIAAAVLLFEIDDWRELVRA